MTMPLEPGVVDANILIYAVNSAAPQHAASRTLLEAALDPAVSLCVTSQIICEFYSLMTNPKCTAMANRFAISRASFWRTQAIAMPANNIHCICNFNVADCQRFPELTVVTP